MLVIKAINKDELEELRIEHVVGGSTCSIRKLLYISTNTIICFEGLLIKIQQILMPSCYVYSVESEMTSRGC